MDYRENDLRVLIEKFPPRYRDALDKIVKEKGGNLEEIRMKAGEKILVYARGKEHTVDIILSQKDIEGILNNILEYSVYAHQEELMNGFVTIPGGHRIGICGKAVKSGGIIKTIKEVSSLNIRCTKEIIGVSQTLMRHIFDQKRIRSCLIVSPPKCGKTTLIRDIVRNLSYSGYRVGLVDERSEIAGMYQGISQNDLGPRTDILDGFGKAEGMIMMIRAMSPEVICSDEIGKEDDARAVYESLCAGISVITTIHGNSYQEIRQSKISELIQDQIFERIFFLSNIPTIGTVKQITDGGGKSIAY